jgi:glutamate decarboxylase
MVNMHKNMINQNEYPMTRAHSLLSPLELLSADTLHRYHLRASMLANLWYAPHSHNSLGVVTTGSSEAIQLGGLAM